MVDGLVGRRIEVGAAQLDRGDALVATLDCTGGFYSTQHWRGVLLGRLLDEAGIEPAVEHVRVISRTGYRWSFGLEHARGLLLATRTWVTSRSATATARRADSWSGRRGFEWIKWVARVELRESPDPGAVASTVWSSLSAAGRGAA